MNRIFKTLLKKYDPQDRELYLKARFVLGTTLFMIVSLTCILLYTRFLTGVSNIVIMVELAGYAVILVGVGLLVRGLYNAAVHTILIAAFSVVWIVLFVGPDSSVLTILDTIVFIPALLAALPLMMLNDRRPMVLYFAVNLIIFICFNFYISRVFKLPFRVRVDFFMDNLVAIVFVFFISFSLFSIYRQVLNSLQKELADRRSAEEKLKKSEYLLSAHLQNTPVGATSWDMDYRVTEWNPAAERIFGYTKAEAMGKHMADLIVPPDKVEMVTNIYRNLLSGSGGERSVNENVTKYGTRILCDWYNTVIRGNDGRIIGLASLVNDVTETKKTQELMIQTEKMMSVGGLAAGMAHEINNPLAGMVQNAQVIHNRMIKDLPANIEAAQKAGISMDDIRHYMEKRNIIEYLENISKAGQRAARIIRNMLSFSRKSSSEREWVSLPELVDATIELAQSDYDLKKQHDFKNIRIQKEYGSGLPGLLCEKSKIQQVLFNLLKNASESMSEQAHKREPEITIRLTKREKTVLLEVADNGPGMDEDIRKRIFEPFFTTKDVNKGTGLGLSVSYFIIKDNHGGEMQVESRPGQGARFIITLPISKED